MEIRHLRLIREVADKGSLTKATETLFLSQSALSHQLKELEEQLGTPLFHRVNKKLVITGAGKIVLNSAEKILQEIDDTVLSVRRFANGDTGSVRVATECYTCYHWLPGMMTDFNREFPKVSIEISDEIVINPVDQLLSGKLDLGIVSYKIEDPAIISRELFTDEMVAVVPKNHPWTSKKIVNAKDFEDETLIIHSYPLSTATVYNEVLEPAGIMPKKISTMSITDARLEMIKAGMGVSVVPKWIIAPYIRHSELTTLPVTRKGLFITWYALFMNQEEVPQYIENFVEHLRCNVAGICLSRAS